MTSPNSTTDDSQLLPATSTMKIKGLKSELASYGICAVNILEKKELIIAVEQAREKRGLQAAAVSEPPHTSTTNQTTRAHEGNVRREESSDITTMSIKELKRELESFGISTNQFFEKSDLQTAVKSARTDNEGGVDKGPKVTKRTESGLVTPAPTSTSSGRDIFPASLSDTFEKEQKNNNHREQAHRQHEAANNTAVPTTPKQSSAAGVSEQYSWCKDRSAHSKPPTSKPETTGDLPHVSPLVSDSGFGNDRPTRLPKSYFPVNTFDSGTDGELLGGNTGAGLRDDSASASPAPAFTRSSPNMCGGRFDGGGISQRANMHEQWVKDETSNRSARGSLRVDIDDRVTEGGRKLNSSTNSPSSVATPTPSSVSNRARSSGTTTTTNGRYSTPKYNSPPSVATPTRHSGTAPNARYSTPRPQFGKDYRSSSAPTDIRIPSTDHRPEWLPAEEDLESERIIPDTKHKRSGSKIASLLSRR